MIRKQNHKNIDKTLRTIQKLQEKYICRFYSQANFPSNDDNAIPNAWIAHNGYLKSHVNTSKVIKK